MGSSLSPPPRAGSSARADQSPAASGSICSTVRPDPVTYGWRAAVSIARPCMITVATMAPTANTRDMRQPLRNW